MHSFISPRHKHLYDKNTLLWLVFVTVISAALLSFGGFLRYKSYFLKDELETIISSNKVLSKSVIGYGKEISILTMQKTLAQEVSSSNVLLKNSIKNLFDLVPDQIVLTKVMMQKDLLSLEGTTSTKDTYRLLLEPPLKSIFNSSQVTYKFNAKLGRYDFKSLNRVIAESKEKTDAKK